MERASCTPMLNRGRTATLSSSSCALFCSAQVKQSVDPGVGGWVGAEQTEQSAGTERLDDEHVRGRRIRVERDDFGGRFDFSERADKAVRAAGDAGAAGVGVE